MAKLIPNVLKDSVQSRGEVKIFNYFKNENELTKDWIILHSLDIAQHRKKKRGEADFIVLIPNKGIICAEVKAHSHISRINGISGEYLSIFLTICKFMSGFPAI